MKYIFNKTADNYSYFSDLFNNYFKINPIYKEKTTKKYTLKDEFKPGFFSYIKDDTKTRKSPLFNANYTPSANDLSSLWTTFTPKLNNYYYFTANPSYDFFIDDTPVKVHGNYIQIGSNLIPKNADLTFFNKLDSGTKTTVYNVIIEINNIFIS